MSAVSQRQTQSAMSKVVLSGSATSSMMQPNKLVSFAAVKRILIASVLEPEPIDQANSLHKSCPIE